MYNLCITLINKPTAHFAQHLMLKGGYRLTILQSPFGTLYWQHILAIILLMISNDLNLGIRVKFNVNRTDLYFYSPTFETAAFIRQLQVHLIGTFQIKILNKKKTYDKLIKYQSLLKIEVSVSLLIIFQMIVQSIKSQKSVKCPSQFPSSR